MTQLGRELARELLAAVRDDVELRSELRALLMDVLGAELVARRTNGREWLTLREAAELLGCSPDAVRMRAARGRLHTRRQGRRVYVSAASVRQLDGAA